MKEFLTNRIGKEFYVKYIIVLDNRHYLVTIMLYDNHLDGLLKDILVEIDTYNVFIRESKFNKIFGD